MIDLSFAVIGQQPLPADHGYALYGAISRLLPELHTENGIAVHSITGRQVGNRQLMLTDRSRLTLRVADGQIAPLLKLAGKSLRLADAVIRVGVPQVRSLTPASALRSRLVVIKVKGIDAKNLTPEIFAVSARKQLEVLEIAPAAILTPGKRRTLRVKQREIVGYEVVLKGLTAEESLKIQEHGLGGKRHMGCGVFVALRIHGVTNE